MKPNSIESEALHLPVEQRAHLAQRLLESLDSLSEEESTHLWAKEAERRAREIDEGSVELVSAEELDRRVDARLK